MSGYAVRAMWHVFALVAASVLLLVAVIVGVVEYGDRTEHRRFEMCRESGVPLDECRAFFFGPSRTEADR